MGVTSQYVATQAQMAAGASTGSTITIVPTYGVADVGNWAYAVNVAFPLNGAWSNAAGPAINDACHWVITLTKGTYTLRTSGRTHPAYGIQTWKLDGTTIGTEDMYSAGDVYPVQSEIAGIAVAESGVKTLSLVMASKNGASSNYGSGGTQSIVLERTA